MVYCTNIMFCYFMYADAQDWHLHSLLLQIQACIDSNPSDLDKRPSEYHGKWMIEVITVQLF